MWNSMKFEKQRKNRKESEEETVPKWIFKLINAAAVLICFIPRRRFAWMRGLNCRRHATTQRVNVVVF